MSLAEQVLSFAGTFNVWLVLSIFIMLTLGEFGTSIPYVMETIWILVGYHVTIGSFSVFHLVLLWLVAVTSRTLGAVALYYVAGLGRGPIMKLYNRFFGKVIAERLSGTGTTASLPARLLRRINLLSPYSVAFGRLIWLRVPLTILLSMRRQLLLLVEAVVLFSLIWDATYILIGIIGGNIKVNSTDVILYSLGGLTFLYAMAFVIRRLSGWWLSRHQ
ncbi:MAG: hypothetical protein ABR958_00765 [Dehalococcoidales bacterium]|jgi:membrane-associated protein